MLGSITKNGVTLTNNGDGTFTLNGTSTTDIYFDITTSFVLPKGTYKLTGTPSNRGNSSMYEIIDYRPDLGEGVILEEDGTKNIKIGIVAYKGTYNNVIYKPMITKDLNATYNNFVSHKEGLALAIDVEQLTTAVQVPYEVGSGKEAFIGNCKYLSSVSEPNKPSMYVIEHAGRGIVWGYTYESIEDPSWAQYLYTHIGLPNVYVLWCWEHTWRVYTLNWTEI